MMILNATNYMFLGGLIMAIAVEHCGLHNRVALRIIMMVGTSQARLMLGFMFTTMFLSMWISNTATTAMMLPIVDAVAMAISEGEPETGAADDAESLHESEAEDEFNHDEYDLPFNQRTFTSINQLTVNSINQMTMNSLGNFNPANDPESMVAFLPNVRRNTLEKLPGEENPRERFQRKNTMERIGRQQSQVAMLKRQESADNPSLLSKEEIKQVAEGESIKLTVDIEESSQEETERNFLLLSVAYAANIGGTGVITGSPPNLVVPDTLIQRFGDGTGLTFASWMAFAIPVMLVNLVLAWLWLQQLQRWYLKGKKGKGKEEEERAMKVIKDKYAGLGSMNLHEAQVLVLFVILIALWFFKTPIFMSILLFILPQTYDFWPFTPMKNSLKNAPSLITWRLIETKMCWGVIFLLGGGFALAKAAEYSGLSTLLVELLSKVNLESLPLPATSFIICFVTVTITNVASNTATANVLVPILAKMAVTMCINPIYLTLPAE